MRPLVLTCLLASPALIGAQTAPSAVSPQPLTTVQSSGVTLRTNSQLIVVDVTVQDKDGNPVHGLKASDFRLLERKANQTIKSLEEHTTANAVTRPRMPKLPIGTFTDYAPVPTGSALNVILLDLLNTPITDQAYVVSQLKKYVRSQSPTATTAIYGLNSSLTVLQGFTSDPEVLKYAIDHKSNRGASILLDDASGAGIAAQTLSSQLAGIGLGSTTAITNLKQFESDQASFEIQYRSRATLEAFRSIAGFLSKYPGRKNLVWFSGSFPFAILPDETIEDPFSVAFDNAADMRYTTNLLDRARVAVYPVDARGVRTLPAFDAAAGDMSVVHATATANAPATADAANSFAATNTEEHMTMTEMAYDTGGRAYFNLNDLSAAMARAVADGANYYTLTYAPTDRNYHGEFRQIHVDVTTPNGHALKLSYRHGYFADDPFDPKAGRNSPILTGDAAVDLAPPQTALNTAMVRGGPTPSDILFTARILPSSTTTEDVLAEKNTANPDGKFKGPFRRVDVDFAVVTKDVNLSPGKDNLRHGELEFVAYVYDVKGKLLNGAGDGIRLDIDQATYDKLRRGGIEYRLQVSVPAKTESMLRVAVHDRHSGKVGVIEVANSDILRLPPLPSTGTNAAPASPAH